MGARSFPGCGKGRGFRPFSCVRVIGWIHATVTDTGRSACATRCRCESRACSREIRTGDYGRSQNPHPQIRRMGHPRKKTESKAAPKGWPEPRPFTETGKGRAPTSRPRKRLRHPPARPDQRPRVSATPSPLSEPPLCRSLNARTNLSADWRTKSQFGSSRTNRGSGCTGSLS